MAERDSKAAAKAAEQDEAKAAEGKAAEERDAAAGLEAGDAEGGQVAATYEEVPAGHVRVALTQHWTDPDSGENHLPGKEVTVTEDRARGLMVAGYVARDEQGHPVQVQQGQGAQAAAGEQGESK